MSQPKPKPSLEKFESFAERKIREAQAEGQFDSLPGFRQADPRSGWPRRRELVDQEQAAARRARTAAADPRSAARHREDARSHPLDARANTRFALRCKASTSESGRHTSRPPAARPTESGPSTSRPSWPVGEPQGLIKFSLNCVAANCVPGIYFRPKFEPSPGAAGTPSRVPFGAISPVLPTSDKLSTGRGVCRPAETMPRDELRASRDAT